MKILGLDIPQFGADKLILWGEALLILFLGFVLAKIARRAIRASLESSWDSQAMMLILRATNTTIFCVALSGALSKLGFDWKLLLGAAGVFTVAIGFAAQTSASNLISGLFLIVERPFVIGDSIRVGDTEGEVASLDLLSTWLRTLDNRLVRIPNETIVKSQITNLTHFPIRRIDFRVGVSYSDDIEKVKQVLDEIADENPYCLEEPQPLFIFEGFGESSVDLKYCVWTTREKMLECRNQFQMSIKKVFHEKKINIPYPHREVTVITEDPSLAKSPKVLGAAVD